MPWINALLSQLVWAVLGSLFGMIAQLVIARVRAMIPTPTPKEEPSGTDA